MSRGRTPRSRPQSDFRSPVRRAAEAAVGQRTTVEQLEDRRMLTTLVGGQSFIYADAANQRVQITLTGSITAEFIGARISRSSVGGRVPNQAILRDLIEPSPDLPNGGTDLFSIYVAEAGPDASIFITRIDSMGRPTPYGGNAGSVRVTTLGRVDVDDPLFGISGPGGVYVGARTVNTIENTTTEENIPITSVRNSTIFGVRPSTRTIYAGLQTAPGINLQNVFIGGTITGIVNVEGSVGTFYAGSVLTGDAGGVLNGGRVSATNNFSVAGDLQRFYVGGAIGTNDGTDFRTGFNLRVGGRIGYVHTVGNFIGQVQDRFVTEAPAVTTAMPEAEQYYPNANATNAAFLSGQLAQSVTGDNNTVGGLNNQFSYTDGDNNMSWSGVLQNTPQFNDGTDNYSLPLMAGQKATLQLVSGGAAVLSVIDPTGRTVATDLSGPTGSGVNQQFQYTAKIPGVYTLSVVNNNFIGILPYTLTANAAGKVPVGGVDIGGRTEFREPGNGVALRNGDLGAWRSGGDISGDTGISLLGVTGSPINLSRGNLRALYSNGNLGVETNIFYAGLLDLVVPRGSVGHLRSGATMAINPNATLATGEPNPAAAIGGDYQRVEAIGDLSSDLVANGRIGTILAASIDDNGLFRTAPVISVNTDQRGSDGTIDMIYVTGNVGNTAVGGPALYNGLDGNIKYFYVGGNVIRDFAFGVSLTNQITLENGRAIDFVDDSGARAIIRPTSDVVTGPAPAGSVSGTTVNPITGATTVIGFNPVTGVLTQTVTSPGALDYTAYPVRGVGGQVMINLHSTTSLDITGRTSGQVDIANLVTNGTGTATSVGTLGLDNDSDGDGFPDVLVDINRGVTTTVGYPVDTTTTPPADGTIIDGTNFTTVAPDKNEINFYGSTPVNVFQIVGNTTATGIGNGTGTAVLTGTSNITAINNFTSGEVVSVNAANLGTINARTVGMMSGAGATDVEVPGNITSAAPFNDLSRGINVTGSMISVLARDGIGNVAATGTINTVNPNTDGKNARGINDGINGAVRAGTLNVVQIGEGVAFGGSGAVVGGGVFANTAINNVVGNDADIRGPVVSLGVINSIVLTNGSIVNARIGTLGTFESALFNAGIRSLTDPSSNLGFALNQILIRGNGGIIGSDLAFGNFSNITVEGFGIIGTTIASTASNNIDGQIVANGFGIRSSNIDVGTSIRTVTAAGNGRVLSTASYNQRVNQSGGPRRLRYDPYSGRLLGGTNDLNRFFGTTRTSPRLSGATNAGVIADTRMTGSGTLGTLNAYAISTADLDTPIGSALLFPNRIAFSSNIGNVNVTHTISGLQLNTGKLDNLTVGTNLQRATIGVAGEIGSINVGGTIRGTTTINAQNANGRIGSLVVRGGLYGTVTSRGQIGSIAADTIGAQITSTAGGISRIGVNGSILSGSFISASQTIDRVIIGGDFENDATIRARDIKVFRVAGDNLGDLIERNS